MSLINDALKRASQSDKNRPAQARLPLPMQPAVAAARTNGKSSSLLIAAIIVAVLGLGAACLLLFTSRNAERSVVASARVPAVKPVSLAVTPPSPSPAAAAKQNMPPAAAPVASPAIAVAPASAPSPALMVADTFPTNLTVKAIFYSKTNPRALVNDRTVETGDRIGDVLVTGITSDRVFFDWKGQSKALMMGGQ